MPEAVAVNLDPRGRPRIGLILGAGGIRGCAHAGVIAELREAEIPIDLVVGASVGAIFGLAMAAGLPTEYLTRVAREATPLDLFRFYAGRLRLDRRNPISRMLLDAGGDRQFSDLTLPFAVVATDMATGEPVVIDRGPVLPAVQASIALPFVARPVRLQGRFCLDGGLLDTAPYQVAHEMGAERSITVCLGFNYAAPRVLRRRPWTQPALERIGRQRRPLRGRLGDQLRFTCRLCAATFQPSIPAQDADLVIWPEFNGLNPNSIFGAQFCYQQGITATREALPAIKLMLRERDPALL